MRYAVRPQKTILFTGGCLLFILVFLLCNYPYKVSAQALDVQKYDIGTPVVMDVWVDYTNGNDSNNGSSRSQALKTLNAAWNLIPEGQELAETGYRVMLAAGNYPRDSIPNYLENRLGTAQFPVIFQSADGRGKAQLNGDLNIYNSSYFYLIDIAIMPDPPGDAFHCEKCNHFLIRGTTLSVANRAAQEVIKINQSQYIYIEDSDISGAYDNAIDFVAVQYGHVKANRIHDSEDWCFYAKGGSGYLLVEGNEVFNCGTGGITAGQGTGFEYMVSPWLHYESYDIKIINNLIHDTNGAGLGVNGGYNILLAYNTLYRVGARSHLIEVVFGSRSCDGDTDRCTANLQAGGWGTVSADSPQLIPDRNVYIYNNLIYNPDGYQSGYQHFAIYGSQQPSDNSNIPAPARTDTNLQIKGNIIWNGSADYPLGIEDENAGCPPANPTCNAEQLRRDNMINIFQPQLVNPVIGDFHPISANNGLNARSVAIPDFVGGDLPQSWNIPGGNIANNINRDLEANQRSDKVQAGALLAQGSVASTSANVAHITTPSVAQPQKAQAALFNTLLALFFKALGKLY
ncbi:right-handed parallel beta-helix repeat-containing protein [Candidatus Chlorohelix sp.]|uniref:right-handed parallel beta-helix repeat-containing protein n=1 Tax=Candidatus Chlorohelix sp. TaxID=3139201 RepID=UPI0030426366